MLFDRQNDSFYADHHQFTWVYMDVEESIDHVLLGSSMKSYENCIDRLDGEKIKESEEE